MLSLRPWLASALRRQAELTGDEREREKLLKRANQIAKTAVRVARKFQNDLPHALREVAQIKAMQGSSQQARKAIDESLDVSQRQGARYEHAQSLLARGTMGRKLGWPNADEDIATARKTLLEMGADFAMKY